MNLDEELMNEMSSALVVIVGLIGEPKVSM
jgi:hypothetical protein